MNTMRAASLLGTPPVRYVFNHRVVTQHFTTAGQVGNVIDADVSGRPDPVLAGATRRRQFSNPTDTGFAALHRVAIAANPVEPCRR